MLKTPFPWFGGKSKASDLIWSRFGAGLGAAGSETALSLAAISCLLVTLWVVDPTTWRDLM